MGIRQKELPGFEGMRARLFGSSVMKLVVFYMLSELRPKIGGSGLALAFTKAD
jgi:hypothetical protein